MRDIFRSLPAIIPVTLLAMLLVGLGVVVDPSAYDVSQMPRLLVLSLALAGAVPVILGIPGVRRRLDTTTLREPVVVAAAAYLASCVASLAVTLNVTAGYTDVCRTLAAFVVLAAACLVLPLDRDWRRTVVGAFVLATAVHAAVGIHETLTILGPGLHDRRAMEVITGRMSNVNLHAGLLAMLLPWCGAGVMLPCGRGWRWFSTLTAVAATTMLVMLQSRSAWLAAAAAGMVMSGVVVAAARRLALPRAVRLAGAGLALAAMTAAAGGAALTFTDTPIGETLRATFIRRPHQAAGPTDGGRTMIWRIATQMIADHPLLGVGAGNFTVRLHEYYGGEDLDFSNLSSDNWIQPHDDFLWVWAEKGLPGVLAFVAVFATAGLAIRTVLRRGTIDEARLAVACLGALTAYLVFSIFDFPLDRVTFQVHLAILLAVITLQKHDVAPASRVPLPLPAWLVAPPLTAAMVLAACFAAAALDQERNVIAARQAARNADWPGMLAAARRAETPWKSLDPLATPIAFLEGMARLRLGDPAAATTCLEQALAANPNRMYVVNNLAALYAEAGRYDDAVPLFALAAERYPDRIEPRHNLAACLIDAGRYGEAIAVIEDIPAEVRPEPMRAMLEHAREQRAASAP
ncbi:MAG: O-antigen ligase family protein [Planctomycetaceae bacterium]